MKNLLYIFLFLVCSFILFSSGHEKTIKGFIYDVNNHGLPVDGATVKIEGTVLGAITNAKGFFIIRKVPEGKYNLVITYIGLKTIKKEIELIHQDGDEVEMNFEMTENPVYVENVVVTATRSEKIYDDVPIKVSQLTNSDILSTSSTNIREALQYQPGVRTEVDCQNCGFSQVRINGLDGKYSQLLIDGKPMISSLNGIYGLDQIPSNMIDKVEVIRGGGSSVYGGNAISGVINIITKTPEENSYEILYNNLLINNNLPENVLSFNGNIISEEQSTGISLFGMRNYRHQFDANGDDFSEISQLNLLTLGSKMFYKFNSKTKIVLEVNNINHKSRGGNKFDLPPHQAEIAEMVEHNTIMSQINYEQYIGESDKLNIYSTYQNTDRNSYYGSNKDLNAYGNTFNRAFSSGINYYTIFEDFFGDHSFNFGYDLTYDEITDNALAYSRKLHQIAGSNGVFFQDDWIISDKFNILLGLRIDKNNKIDNLIFNPRASLLYKPFENFSIRTTYSTGYRAPQAFDEDLHVSQVGGEAIYILLDKNLKPEFSRSFSASFDYSTEFYRIPIAFSLETFYTGLYDAFSLNDIGTDLSGNRILLRTNSDTAIVKGATFEIQSSYQDHFMLKIGYTYQTALYSKPIVWSLGDSTNQILPQSSDRIFRSPNNYGYILLSLSPFPELNFDFSAYFTGSIILPHYAGFVPSDKLEETKSFVDLNAKISYLFIKNPNIEISLGVQNILNSYQKDFDSGINRDSGYFYGPFRPITSFLKFRIYS